MMSPLQIEIMLHHYYTPLAWPKENPPGFRWLLDAKLLEKDDDPGEGESPYTITERGRAYVQTLLCAPIPEAAWINPATGGVIKVAGAVNTERDRND